MSEVELIRRDARITHAEARNLIASPRHVLVIEREDGGLLGLVGDGELRAAARAGLAESTGVEGMMATDVAELPGTGREDAAALALLDAGGQSYAVARSGGRVEHVYARRLLAAERARPETAVLMVGGEGTRLRPLTDELPKPLLPVGGVPILERIVRSLVAHRVPRIVMALGYRGEQIEERFGDGARFGAEIRYVREKKPLGTAGAIGLVQDPGSRPLLVMNGDILTELDFSAMAVEHERLRSAVTVAARPYQHRIPYGVLRLMESRVVAVEEKPAATWWTNAGVYLMNPEVPRRIAADRYVDMTMLIESLIGEGERIDAFPLREYWCDIGRPEDYAEANQRWAPRA